VISTLDIHRSDWYYYQICPSAKKIVMKKLRFYIPEKIQGHEVGNALVLGAERSHLCEGNELLEIEGGRGVKVVLLLAPEGTEAAQSYTAFEWNGSDWETIELPVYTFNKVVLGELLEVEGKNRQVYPDLNSSL